MKEKSMMLLEWTSQAFLLIGAAFFTAASVGLLRFPDVYTRLHALAKVDNLGLGFILLGLLLQAESMSAALKLVLVWLLAQAASAATCFLIARRAWCNGRLPWRFSPQRKQEGD
jgi:multicomponent Na+:H+ antiporter subunit G